MEISYLLTNMSPQKWNCRETFFMVWKQTKKKANKTKRNGKHTNNNANIKTEKQKHSTWKQKQNNRRKKQTTLKQIGFEKGILGKFVWMNEANINKGKGQNERQKNPPPTPPKKE